MRLVETQAIERPRDDVAIWRYMDVAKFLDLLCSRRLFFCNGARLSDQAEGEIPEAIREVRREAVRRAAIDKGLADRDLDEELMAHEWNERRSAMPELALVNCWSMSDDESYALWKVYLSGQPFGVAIRSTVGRLLKAIERGSDPYPEDFYVGNVWYSEDLPGDSWHRLRLLTRKMPFYRYEHEMRLIVLNYPRSEGGTRTPYALGTGRHVQVDSDTLVEKIVLSPFAPSHFHEALTTIIRGMAPDFSDRAFVSRIRDS